MRYVPADDVAFDDFTDAFLRGWVCFMLLNDVSPQTAKYYLDNISSLYNKAVKLGLVEKRVAFTHVKAKIAGCVKLPDEKTTLSDMRFLRELIVGAKKLSGEQAYLADLFLFSFFNRGMSVGDMLRLCREDVAGMCLPARKIAGKYMSVRREKVFPRGRVADIERKISLIINHIGGISFSGKSVSDVSGLLWMNVALRLGVSPADVRGCVSGEVACNAGPLCIMPETTLPDGRIAEITAHVAEEVSSNPVRWYVMKLRRQNTFDRLCARLSEEKHPLPQFFYPCEEIANRIGKKLVYEQQPVIPDVVFFKSTEAEILPMFRVVGDLAWCYRNERNGSYAVVPQCDMERFQRAIGVFTPDFDIVPIGTNSVEVGQWVRITGGAMAGYEGEVCDIADQTVENFGGAQKGSAIKLFRIHLPGDNGFEWKMTVDERFIEPVSCYGRNLLK